MDRQTDKESYKRHPGAIMDEHITDGQLNRQTKVWIYKQRKSHTEIHSESHYNEHITDGHLNRQT